MYTVKKPEPHTARCEPHMARQFRKPHLAHKEPHMAHKEPHVARESNPHVALCEPCVARREPGVAHISKFSVESDLYMSHVWIFVSHVWLFVSHVWITKIIWENCQLREIYRNILLVKASWWLWIIISHNSKPLKADVDLKWRSYRYQLKWSPEKWLGQESQRNWKC